jgi:hypothetical protein
MADCIAYQLLEAARNRITLHYRCTLGPVANGRHVKKPVFRGVSS